MRVVASRVLPVIFLLASSSPALVECQSNCKPNPSSPNWPSLEEWQALNSSVSGRLIAAHPPGAVCHSDLPQFNNASCAILQSQWPLTTFHAAEPVSVDFNDFTCQPEDSAPCSGDGYPAYVIAANCAEDVQAGVKFAHKTGVRLTVKGTGHDFLGRSSGAGALNIWTHNIQGIEVKSKFPEPGPSGEVAAVKIAAGMRVGEILKEGAEQNLTIVTGSDSNVGIGGWITGGGHSPISARYGMGADQVLEMEVVTADGQLLTLNDNSNSDLFWAMRGGGGSTFAVLTSVTVRAFPALNFVMQLLSFNTTADSDTYWNVTALFNSYVPSLAEAGAMGYYFMIANDANETNPAAAGKIAGIYLVPDKTQEQAAEIFAPVEAAIRDRDWADNVTIDSFSLPPAPYSDKWRMLPPGGASLSGQRLGSRLLDKKALQADEDRLASALKQANLPGGTLIGHMIASPGTRDVKVAGGSSSVNPVWRRTYTHIVSTTSWEAFNETQEKERTDELRNFHIQALRDLAPDMGAYVNEADPTEPNWQQAFWGDNYPRLFEIKKKWDPEGVFWCTACVGSELWTTEGGDGIGQSPARICRKG